MAQHSRKGAQFQALTANRLADGIVVYLTAADGWSESLQEADVAEGKEAGEALLARAQAAVDGNIVVEPYLFEVTRDEFYGSSAVWPCWSSFVIRISALRCSPRRRMRPVVKAWTRYSCTPRLRLPISTKTPALPSAAASFWKLIYPTVKCSRNLVTDASGQR